MLEVDPKGWKPRIVFRNRALFSFLSSLVRGEDSRVVQFICHFLSDSGVYARWRIVPDIVVFWNVHPPVMRRTSPRRLHK
jgi:hypothetical protein